MKDILKYVFYLCGIYGNALIFLLYTSDFIKAFAILAVIISAVSIIELKEKK